MSLFLPEQKVGSHSERGSSSHKFMLKGRQTGGMHRGHAWVFRAESFDAMMAWFADIRELTQKSGKERDAFVRRSHARSLSGGSMKAHSMGDSSDGGLEEDEADAQPYSSEQSVRGASGAARAGGLGIDHEHGRDNQASVEGHDQSDERPEQRPSPGGRFPSDLNVHRSLQASLSPSSGESSTERDRDAIAAASALPGPGMAFTQSDDKQQQQPDHVAIPSEGEKSMPSKREERYQEETATRHSHAEPPFPAPQQHSQELQYSQPQQRVTENHQQYPQSQQEFTQPQQGSTQPQQEFMQPQQQYTQPQQGFTHTQQQYSQPSPQNLLVLPPSTTSPDLGRTQPDYRTSTTTGVRLGALNAPGTNQLHEASQHQQQRQPETVTEEMDHASGVPLHGTSSPPIMTDNAMVTSSIDPTNTSHGLASSWQADTGSLSTVPASIGSANRGVDASQQIQTPVAQQVGTETTTATQPLAEVENHESLVTKPVPLRTMTAGTISDLHIPGEYPKTPKLAQ